MLVAMAVATVDQDDGWTLSYSQVVESRVWMTKLRWYVCVLVLSIVLFSIVWQH